MPCSKFEETYAWKYEKDYPFRISIEKYKYVKNTFLIKEFH